MGSARPISLIYRGDIDFVYMYFDKQSDKIVRAYTYDRPISYMSQYVGDKSCGLSAVDPFN